MVPKDPSQIPAATAAALDHLTRRLASDRESLARSGYPDGSAAMALLNTLMNEADVLKKAVVSSEPTIEPPLDPTLRSE